MPPNPSFLIYNASAGSGKTYTLVAQYLTRLLERDFPDSYKFMLAITFTNKAVAEMKSRIIEKLTDFADPASVSDPDDMMSHIAKELDISIVHLQRKSANLLHHLLHHFAAFNVETIDSFNHRLIRTFSRELKIASNFEVTLDRDLLLEKAVDNVVAKSGTDKELTDLLIEYTLQKTDDDRSWDISRDIIKTASNLFKEEDFREIESLLDVPLTAYRALSKKLRNKRDQITQSIEKQAKAVLDKISDCGIPFEAFKGKGTLPNHFNKIIDGQRKSLYKNQLEQNLEDGGNALYPKTTHDDIAGLIDGITAYLRDNYMQIKSSVYKEVIYAKIIDSLGPLSVLSLVYAELERIKTEDNLMPISDFNRHIHREIKEQPAPYIYERLGDRFRNFFIDEFQDTSVLQWTNIQPLIDNALSQEFDDGRPGSLLLVGDPKQSIYRWRGGRPEQFIDLYNCQNPFSTGSKDVKNLEKNWRSRAEIVRFNNEFFTYIADHLSDRTHQTIYELGNKQDENELAGGYISLQFLPWDINQEIQAEHYGKAILESIHELQEDGFQLSDICILCRWNREGIRLGEFLSAHNIQIISSETLLLKHSAAVRFIANCLCYRENQSDNDLAFEILLFLYENSNTTKPLHNFLKRHVQDGDVNLPGALERLSDSFKMDDLFQKSPLEAGEYLIHCYKLKESEKVYVEGFMNLLHEFEQQRIYNELSFTSYWNTKQKKAALSSADGVNALTIMTIHKSKGLEFPVVLFPYADISLSDYRRMNVWLDTSDLDDEIDKAHIPFSDDLQHYSVKAADQFNKVSQLHEFDQVNLLYVAMTRAIDALYIYTRIPSKSRKKDAPPDKFCEFFEDFLKHKSMWQKDQTTYALGRIPAVSGRDKSASAETVPLDYTVSMPSERQLTMAAAEAKLWYSRKDEAVSRGSILHDLMAAVKHADDLEPALITFSADRRIPEELRNETADIATSIVNNPETRELFTNFEKVETEREILSQDSEILRPDRINFNTDGSLTVVDYKTGQPEEVHKKQLYHYSATLEAMGFRVRERLIIYAAREGLFVNMA